MSDQVSIQSVSGDVVTGTLAATQNHGSVKTFAGTYTVTGDAIVNFAVEQTS